MQKSLQGKENEVAVQTLPENAFRNILENEGLVLEVNDKVTLNRRVGRNQVKGEIVKQHLIDHMKLCYNIKSDSGAIFYKLSEFELVKSSMRLRDQQKHDDEESLALLPTKQIFQEKRMLDFSSAMVNLKKLQDEYMKAKKSRSGPRTQSDWLEYAKKQWQNQELTTPSADSLTLTL